MGSLMHLIGGIIGSIIATYLGAPLWAGLLAFMAGGISLQLIDIESKLRFLTYQVLRDSQDE